MSSVVPCLCFFVIVILPSNSETKRQQASHVRLLPGRLVQRFESIEECNDVAGMSVHLANVQVHENAAKDGYYTFNFTIDRRIEKILKVVVYIQNCRDKTKTSCQLFQTWRFYEEACDLFAKKHQVWSPLFENIVPEVVCPMAPGKYDQTNGSFNMDLIRRLPFPLEKYFWRVRLELYDPDMFACFLFAGYVLRTRT